MAWVDQATAILALRNLIFDGPNDKLCSQKKVIGPIDGVNRLFKTFEYRRTQSFVTASSPIGVYKNGVLLASNAFTSDDTVTGTFVLATAPSATLRDSITSTYNYQWFTDSELDSFLQNAATWLGGSSDYSKIVNGLNAAALRFAAQESYEAAAAKYSTRMSEVYKLEDAPSEEILKSMEAFKSMADSFMDKARDLRDDYWTRQGQSKAPNFAFSLGRVRDPQPRR